MLVLILLLKKKYNIKEVGKKTDGKYLKQYVTIIEFLVLYNLVSSLPRK